MKHLKTAAPFLSLVAVLAWQPPVTQGEQERDDARVVRVWAVTPKPDAGKAFNEALEAHAAWRRANEDPWKWDFYRASSGTIDGTVYIRSGGHSHAEMDAYSNSEFVAEAVAHWNNTVMPYVAQMSTQLSRLDDEMVHWPEGDYRVYWVTRFHLRPGHGAAFRESVQAVRAKLQEAGRESVHSWNWAITGEHVPTARLVTARENWAGFDSPEKSARETLTEALGAEQAAAMLDKVYSHVERVSSDIYIKAMEFSGE